MELSIKLEKEEDVGSAGMQLYSRIHRNHVLIIADVTMTEASTTTTPPTMKKFEETEEEERLRFLMELEFIQCLSNPFYLHCKKNCC